MDILHEIANFTSSSFKQSKEIRHFLTAINDQKNPLAIQ